MSSINEVEARDLLVRAVETAWQAGEHREVPVYTVTGPQPQVDRDTVFMHYEIIDQDSDQITVGLSPWIRHRGVLTLNFGAKIGSGKGERALRVMRQEMRTALGAKHFGGVKTLIPTPYKDPKLQGWLFVSLGIPFYYDEQIDVSP